MPPGARMRPQDMPAVRAIVRGAAPERIPLLVLGRWQS